MFDHEGSRGEFLKLLAELGEEPAFIQRARTTDQAWENFLVECRNRREKLLRWPKMHLATLANRFRGDWSRLGQQLVDKNQVSFFVDLYQQWATHSETENRAMTDRGAIEECVRSFERFNDSWTRFLKTLDLTKINDIREGYNEFYPMEKDCAFGRHDALRKFVPLEMVTVEQLQERFPVFEIPKIRC